MSPKTWGAPELADGFSGRQRVDPLSLRGIWAAQEGGSTVGWMPLPLLSRCCSCSARVEDAELKGLFLGLWGAELGFFVCEWSLLGSGEKGFWDKMGDAGFQGLGFQCNHRMLGSGKVFFLV